MILRKFARKGMKIKQKFAQIWIFLNDKPLYHFSAGLSFYTILAIIPYVFIMLSLFLKMEIFDVYYQKLKSFIFANLLPTNQEIFIKYFDKFLQNSENLGLLGLGAILVTSILFFSDFEYAVRKITAIKRRGFWLNLLFFWIFIAIFPAVLIFSFWLSDFILGNLINFSPLSWLNLALILPFFIIWLIFALSYAVSLNFGFSLNSILVSSLVGALFWEIGKFIFMQYALYSKTYTSIYGSFSVILFFFLWVYISWIIFLFGLKLCVIWEK